MFNWLTEVNQGIFRMSIHQIFKRVLITPNERNIAYNILYFYHCNFSYIFPSAEKHPAALALTRN